MAGSIIFRRSCTGPSSQPGQAYDVLLDYWLAQNTQGRHIWPGLFTSRIGAPTKEYPPQEIIEQIGAHAHAPRRGRPRPLQHGRADGKPQGHQRPAARRPLRGAGPGARHALARKREPRRARRRCAASARATPVLPETGRRARPTRRTRSGRATAASGASPSRRRRAWIGTCLPTDDAGVPDAVVVSAVDRLGNESASGGPPGQRI